MMCGFFFRVYDVSIISPYLESETNYAWVNDKYAYMDDLTVNICGIDFIIGIHNLIPDGYVGLTNFMMKRMDLDKNKYKVKICKSLKKEKEEEIEEIEENEELEEEIEENEDLEKNPMNSNTGFWREVALRVVYYTKDYKSEIKRLKKQIREISQHDICIQNCIYSKKGHCDVYTVVNISDGYHNDLMGGKRGFLCDACGSFACHKCIIDNKWVIRSLVEHYTCPECYGMYNEYEEEKKEWEEEDKEYEEDNNYFMRPLEDEKDIIIKLRYPSDKFMCDFILHFEEYDISPYLIKTLPMETDENNKYAELTYKIMYPEEELVINDKLRWICSLMDGLIIID